MLPELQTRLALDVAPACKSNSILATAECREYSILHGLLAAADDSCVRFKFARTKDFFSLSAQLAAQDFRA